MRSGVLQSSQPDNGLRKTFPSMFARKSSNGHDSHISYPSMLRRNILLVCFYSDHRIHCKDRKICVFFLKSVCIFSIYGTKSTAATMGVSEKTFSPSLNVGPHF